MKVPFIILMILFETVVGKPLMTRHRQIENGKKPPKYSLQLPLSSVMFVTNMKNHFNLPKKYTIDDFMKYYYIYSRVDWKEHQ